MLLGGWRQVCKSNGYLHRFLYIRQSIHYLIVSKLPQASISSSQPSCITLAFTPIWTNSLQIP